MEAKRELLFQEIDDLKHALLDEEEQRARLRHYHPKKGELLTPFIHAKRAKLKELQAELDRLDTMDAPPPPSTHARERNTPLDRLRHIFAEGEQLLKKRRSWLRYIFGRHPHVQLAILIEAAHRQAKQIKTDDPELQALLERFMGEADDPWNRSLYQGGFLTYCCALKSL